MKTWWFLPYEPWLRSRGHQWGYLEKSLDLSALHVGVAPPATLCDHLAQASQAVLAALLGAQPLAAAALPLQRAVLTAGRLRAAEELARTRLAIFIAFHGFSWPFGGWKARNRSCFQVERGLSEASARSPWPLWRLLAEYGWGQLLRPEVLPVRRFLRWLQPLLPEAPVVLEAGEYRRFGLESP